MLSHMRMQYIAILGVVGLVLGASGQEPQPAKSRSLSTEDRAQYVRLCQSECELTSQLRLLTELSEDHAKRAPEVPNANTTEKAKWEKDLVQELRDKSTAMLGQLNDVTKRRLAFEAEHGPVASAVVGSGTLEEDKNYSPNEFLYVYKLDEQILKTRQAVIATAEAAKGLYSQLQTNTTPEAVARFSDLLEENNRVKLQWERAQAELELKKLEFRALRKP